MDINSSEEPGSKLKRMIVGRARSPHDRSLFHKLSLVAFFAWVALGADGLSSSSYGPEEAFLALHSHPFLGIFVALGTALTVFIISASYSQIIELFPSGGGGYLVASKLLSPNLGMLSGCALLVDYVLTITISIASGADALFSFLPPVWYEYRLTFAALGVMTMLVLNLRGVKESVIPLVPIFLTFILTHVVLIGYGFAMHLANLPDVAANVGDELQRSHLELGTMGVLLLLLRAYSMGAGTYTGIEAVSNGLPILREPRVETAKKTMRYMAFSLAFMVLGLMLLYLLYGVNHTPGKTLNAVLFESMSSGWSPGWAAIIVFITLASEAALLFIAAQAGFLDGPRILANMALDRWFPTRFASLSDRLVTQNGILIMGISALLMMILTGGSVKFLVVLYSINVFMTFVLSQLGMVRHWWQVRDQGVRWLKRLMINALGFILCSFILVMVIVVKFEEGGWITIFVTGTLVLLVVSIKRHYSHTSKLLTRLDSLVEVVESTGEAVSPEDIRNPKPSAQYDPKAKTAILLVNGFNGLGLHTLFSVIRLFGDVYKNFVFIEVGVVDAGNYKGAEEMDRLKKKVESDIEKYVRYMNSNGYYAEGATAIGIDIVDEVSKLTEETLKKHPSGIIFGGQLVFGKEFFISRWLHNYTVFAVQRRFYEQAVPVVILPIRVY